MPLRNHILESVCNVKVGHMHMKWMKVFTNSNKMSVGHRFWDGDLYAETVLKGSSQNNTFMGVKEAGPGRRRSWDEKKLG